MPFQVTAEELTDVLMGQRSPSIATKTSSSVATKTSSVATKTSSIASKASSVASIDTDTSITVTIRYTGDLVAVVEPIAIAVGEVSVGVSVREAVSLGNTHDTQTPELV